MDILYVFLDYERLSCLDRARLLETSGWRNTGVEILPKCLFIVRIGRFTDHVEVVVNGGTMRLLDVQGVFHKDSLGVALVTVVKHI